MDLLRKPEGKTLEFKRDLSSAEGALRSIVAFANTSGGVLLVGVEDRTRRIVGVGDPLAEEQRLANLITDHIRPRLLPALEILPWRRLHVLGVQVYPSSTRPHHLKALGPEAGVFIRVGSTNRRADPALLQELRRFSLTELFDEQPMPGLDSEAIDFRAASELFAPVRVLRRSHLRSLGLLTTNQGREVPTAGGILLFGRGRERWFPDAWIQTGRFEGVDRRRILDSAEVRSLPARAVEEAIGFVRRNTGTEVRVGEVRHTERHEYPLPAVREALVNAVVHADYSQRGAPIRVSVFADRLEVENPGLLPFGLTIEDIRRGISKLRNRVIGRVFHELGLIEQWGSGIQRMTAACQEAGLREPVLEEIGTHFRVTLHGSRSARPLTDEVDREIIEVLRKGRGLSTKAIGEQIGRTPRATRTRLLRLVQLGLVVEIGSGPRDPRRRYHLAKRS